MTKAPSGPATGSNRPARSAADIFALVFSSGLGSGYFPFASGTAGTLAAVPFAWALSRLSPLPWALVFAGFLVVTIVTAQRAGELHGVADSRYIVADEFAGYFVSVALLPFTWQTAVYGFFLFRLADIVKPWPASHIDRHWKNGLGVTFDDVVAGVYVRVILGLFLHLGWLGG